MSKRVLEDANELGLPIKKLCTTRSVDIDKRESALRKALCDDDDDKSESSALSAITFMDEKKNARPHRWFDDKVPYTYNTKRDGWSLGAKDNRRARPRRVTQEEDSPFGRDLRSYEDGAMISKHCGPYGHSNVLAGEIFSLRRKFFSPDGKIASIEIKCMVAPFRKLLLDPTYFAGWYDTAALEAYRDSML